MYLLFTFKVPLGHEVAFSVSRSPLLLHRLFCLLIYAVRPPLLLFHFFPGTELPLQSTVFYSPVFNIIGSSSSDMVTNHTSFKLTSAPGFYFSSMFCFSTCNEVSTVSMKRHLPRMSLLAKIIICEIIISKTKIFSCFGFSSWKKESYC